MRASTHANCKSHIVQYSTLYFCFLSYVLGHEAMRKMGSSNILISGMKGLGVEVAKDVVLAGVKSVTIHDPDKVELSHLSSQVETTFLAQSLTHHITHHTCMIIHPHSCEMVL